MPPINSNDRLQDMARVLNDDEAWEFIALSPAAAAELEKLDAWQWRRLVQYRRACRAGLFSEGIVS